MNATDKDALIQLDNHLAAGSQSWLFGAGISLESGIPLMWPLTERVFEIAKTSGTSTDILILDHVKSQLADGSHIEHILSHLGDHRSIAERSKNQEIKFGSVTLQLKDLDEFHQRILTWIAETVRWGYKPAKSSGDPEKIGTYNTPIVGIASHLEFFSALFNRGQAGIAERRKAVRLFTTNYDTLIEDALALSSISYWDGFSGGAVAYRNHRYGEDQPDLGNRAHVIKLHGSIDWHLGDDDRVWRVRDGDNFPNRISRVLIYPQSTKYLATQRDPFAAQFDLFRRALASADENVLVTCGYSFGDAHINQEIELSLQRPDNKTTLIAFSQIVNHTLAKWANASWGKRVYIITEKGLYVGANGPFAPPDTGKSWDWWKFSGATKMLNSGAEACAT